jgi:hypothetical protein
MMMKTIIQDSQSLSQDLNIRFMEIEAAVSFEYVVPVQEKVIHLYIYTGTFI